MPPKTPQADPLPAPPILSPEPDAAALRDARGMPPLTPTTGPTPGFPDPDLMPPGTAGNIPRDLTDERPSGARGMRYPLDREDDGERPETQATGEKGPGKLLGHIPVYANDTPEAVFKKARDLRAGNIPVHMGRKFRTKAKINAKPAWPMHAKLKEAAVPIGTEFAPEDMPREELVAYFEAGAIEAVD